VAAAAPGDVAATVRTLVWLAKMGVIGIEAPAAPR